MTYECARVELVSQPTLVVRRRTAIEALPREIPAGTAVQCTHIGPFDRLHDAYEAQWAWLADNGLEHVGPAYEHELDDPAEIPIERVRTLIVVRVR